MKPAIFWWCEFTPGQTEGPFTEAEVQKFLDGGAIAAGARIWSGDRLWPPTAASPHRPSHETRPAWLAPAWAAAVALSLFVSDIFYVVTVGSGSVRYRWLLHAWPWVGASVILLGLGASIALWRTSFRSTMNFEGAAAIRIASIVLAICNVLAGAIQLRQAGIVAAVDAATANWTYSVELAGQDHVVRIRGLIGSGFGHAVKAALSHAVDPVVVEINSDGGLVSEALVAAKAIEERADPTVVVRKECVSACIIVLMSAPRRLMDYDGWIAFHAVSAAAKSQDVLFQWNLAKGDLANRTYLLSKGVPRDYLDEAKRRGPSRVVPLRATTAAAQGLVTGLLDRDRVLSRDEAEKLLLNHSPE